MTSRVLATRLFCVHHQNKPTEANADPWQKADAIIENYNAPMLLRLIIIPVLLALAAFCFYGVLATMEPPGSPILRIVYGVGIAVCLAGSAVTWVWTGNDKK